MGGTLTVFFGLGVGVGVCVAVGVGTGWVGDAPFGASLYVGSSYPCVCEVWLDSVITLRKMMVDVISAMVLRIMLVI